MSSGPCPLWGSSFVKIERTFSGTIESASIGTASLKKGGGSIPTTCLKVAWYKEALYSIYHMKYQGRQTISSSDTIQLLQKLMLSIASSMFHASEELESSMSILFSRHGLMIASQFNTSDEFVLSI